MTLQERIDQAKVTLYSLLLKKKAEEYTNEEIEIAYRLCLDPAIQKMLERRINEKKTKIRTIFKQVLQ